LKAFFKISLIFTLIFLFLGISFLLGLFVRDHFRLQKMRGRVQSRLCRWGLKVLRVKVAERGLPESEDARLFVGNHLSYLDILVLSALYSSSYVTSQEIREIPFLGSLCEAAGCLFVERRDKSNLHKEVSELRTALEKDLSVTVFPEATSTNGEEILRFRSPLYQAACDADVPVQPFCLNYLRIDGRPFGRGNRDFVCWYGDMDFLPHLWALCRLESVDVRVEFLEVMHPQLFEGPKHLAQVSQESVKERFIPVEKGTT